MHSLPNTVRPAIAMIELIFAIVVMGIAMMSAPQLIATAAQSGYVSIEQEAVNEASSHLNNILSYLWDEQLSYVYESGNSYQAVLLSVSHGDGDLNISGQYYRKGTPARSARTFMRGDSTTYSASTIGWDSGESTKGDEDDIDDFDSTSYHLTIDMVNPDFDYIEQEGNITINTSVFYISDSPSSSAGYQHSDIIYNVPTASATSTTNIKEINVTVTSSSGVSELAKSINLVAFSCNISEADPNTFAMKVF